MLTILKKIAIVIFVALVLFLGIMSFFQQKSINEIKSQISATENTSSGKKANTVSANSIAPRISTGKIELPTASPFLGEIKSAAADNLDLETELLKAKNPDKLQADNPKGLMPNPNDYELVKKMVKVSLNDKTQYAGLKKEDLKTGDKIVITADNSPFKADSLTALKIEPYKGQ